jgi:hypothetical protein
MRSRLVALVVLLVVGVMAGPANASGFFQDDDNSVHLRAIEAIADAGITRGCNPPVNDLFCPSASVTREQMATFLVRALGLPAGSASFTDIGSSVHAANIEALASAGITKGCNPPDNTLFCPTAPVTREQMATFLARALHLDVSPRVVVTSAGDLVDVPMGASETETVDQLTALFGPPTGDTTLGCPYIAPPNTRYVRWGSLIVAIKVVDSGDGVLGLVGWRYKLDGAGLPEPGGPLASHVELPFELELGDPIGDAVAAGGGPITPKSAYGWSVVDFDDFTVEANGAVADPNAPIDGVQQGVGFDCE